MERSELSQNTVKDLLNYDPGTGIFKWKTISGNKKKSGVAGYKNKRGYIIIFLHRKPYRAHRLAWFYIHGYWPNQIDHVNHDRSDNRICNLRDSDITSNARNKSRSIINKSGCSGVIFHKKSKKWRATIGINGKNKQLGEFKNFNDAEKLRKSAERHYGYHENHGK